MDISKLIITPWATGCTEQKFNKPTSQMAATLVKERLSLANIDNQRTARVFRNFPKSLKGFVNPETKVSTERKFSMDV